MTIANERTCIHSEVAVGALLSSRSGAKVAAPSLAFVDVEPHGSSFFWSGRTRTTTLSFSSLPPLPVSASSASSSSSSSGSAPDTGRCLRVAFILFTRSSQKQRTQHQQRPMKDCSPQRQAKGNEMALLTSEIAGHRLDERARISLYFLLWRLDTFLYRKPHAYNHHRP